MSHHTQPSPSLVLPHALPATVTRTQHGLIAPKTGRVLIVGLTGSEDSLRWLCINEDGQREWLRDGADLISFDVPDGGW